MKRLILFSMVFLIACSAARAQQATGVVKLKGQIVCCADCWGEEDRQTTPYGTAEDLEKAAQCVANGDPTLLAVMSAEGKTTFYQLESGKFKRPGKNWLDYIGKQVEITGATRSKGDQRYVKVNVLEVLSSPTVAAEPNVIGTEAELVLKDVFSVQQRLSSLRGRVVVLNFWATYCIPCRKEMPDLAAIQNQYAALGVQVIGAAADTAADQPKVLQFIKETKINFPVWLGATAADMKRFGLGTALPGTVVIDRNGKIVAAIRGVVDQAQLKKHIDDLLAASAAQAKKEMASARVKSSQVSSVPS